MLSKILLAERQFSVETIQKLKPFLPSLPPPPIGPDGAPVGPDVLAVLFPSGMIQHEITRELIPEEVRDADKVYRPLPL
jgi:tryptophan synthase beta chain